jgi:hypothetical protein
MSAKTAPSLSTIERILDEVDEWYGRARQIRQKLGRLKRGSPAYLDLLPELEVELGVLKNKADWAARALEEYEESLPDDD